MDPKNSFAFRKLLPIYNCIFLFTYLAAQTVSQDPKFNSCEPKNCGAGPNISYPFWLSQKQESFCGYPNFMLNCSDKGPVLAISNDFYIIEDICYANNSMRLVTAAVYEETCPTPLHNISLDRTTPFTISPGYTDFSFFYNCSSKPKDYNHLYNLSCATNSTHYSFAGFHLEEIEMRSNYSLNSCQDFANAPIHTGEDIGSRVGANYNEVLKMGFLLNWTARNCSTCERSGGRCGFENSEFICFCSDGPRPKSCGSGSIVWKIILVFIGVYASGNLCFCVVRCCRRNASSTTTPIFLKKKHNQDLEVFIRNHGPLALKRYNLSEVKKMTNVFKDKLGQGGYGIVYKGKLQDVHLVAVKVMQASKGDGEEFINEVASISRTSHVNIVTLLGFCLEGDKRVLIYDFMVNGSLEKFINQENALQANQQLGWDKLYQILVGVARGLEYLHRGCNTRIVHFDIKPHNILLDADFCPKISDFGLAKPCARKESNVSLLEARGTIGYIAPEVFSRNFGPVSHKSDVYSYGMMALEIVGGRKNHEAEMSSSSEKYFPDWIYRHLELDDGFELNGVTNAEQSDIVRQIAIVGLWCILTNPSDRPSMRKVIEMLEGPLGALKIPPKPRLYSPPRLLSYSSTTSLV
ncbi:hypothetical protein POTOM_049212 [Populus tomentosa]|uniref:non-specific serine/threonine protein kinase n=1 Tax=Populus tomentosa TaxID=118781 RepID=A0A8X8C340_POPTO|nr:hypothetical protein POTOM_049212 [Populus tomentosa]